MLGGAALGGAAAIGFPAPAQAATYKTVASTSVRNGPSIKSTIVQTLGSGASVSVGSQCAGTQLMSGSSPYNCTWNRLTNGNWIHDHYLNTPANGTKAWVSGANNDSNDNPRAYFLPTIGLPRTTASILGRTQASGATFWAETHLGVNEYGEYGGWCLAFCLNAWRWGVDRTDVKSASTALANWQRIGSSYKHAGDANPPAGALAYWTTTGTAGHVAFSAGSGNLVSTWVGGSNQSVFWTSINTLSARSGWHYLGWAWPYY